MTWLLTCLLLQIVAVQSKDFCLPDVFTDFDDVCFTNFPEEAAVCPNHPFEGRKHGRIAFDTLAEHLYTAYPRGCGQKDKDGNQRCTVPFNTRTGLFATLWSIRSTNQNSYPSYYYGGLSWFQVCCNSVPIIYVTHDDRVNRRIGA